MARIENDPTQEKRPTIKVVGVGGAGGNAVNRMVNSGLDGVEFISINTDAMALENSSAHTKIALGTELTKGLGAGAKPEVGFDAIQESIDEVRAALEGADMVFITAGMGGGTGTGGAPVVAELCKQMGILSVAVVTRPFFFEGPVRVKNSVSGLKSLKETVDTIITIQNQKILSIADKNMSVKDAFAACDEVLVGAVKGISDIILKHGFIQVDFADVKTIMSGGGDAIMGTGFAEGENRAMTAAQRAIHSPLLDDIHIEGSSGILVNITGGDDMGIHEIEEAMSYIYNEVGEDNVPNIIFGTVINPDFEGKISVTVISTGFRKDEKGNLIPQRGITGEQPSFNSSAAAPITPQVTTQQAAPVTQQPQQATSQPVTHTEQPMQVSQPVQPTPQAPQAQYAALREAQVTPQTDLHQNFATHQAPQAYQVPQQPMQTNTQYQVYEEPTSIATLDINPTTQMASNVEKQELEFENQMVALSNEQKVLDEMFTGTDAIEEPTAIVAIQSQPEIMTNVGSSVSFAGMEEVELGEVQEETWNGESSQLDHVQGVDVPAYLRQEASPVTRTQPQNAEIPAYQREENVVSESNAVQAPVEEKVEAHIPNMKSVYTQGIRTVNPAEKSLDLEQPSYMREASYESPVEKFENSYSASNTLDEDDDYETPAFLRNHDY